MPLANGKATLFDFQRTPSTTMTLKRTLEVLIDVHGLHAVLHTLAGHVDVHAIRCQAADHHEAAAEYWRVFDALTGALPYADAATVKDPAA